MRKLILGLATALLFLARPAFATSFAPYPEQCVTDAYGHYYVVVKFMDSDGSRDRITLTIAEQTAGTPPVRSAEAKQRESKRHDPSWIDRDPDICVRVGDTVLGRIKLDRPPGIILVSSTGKGVVTLDEYGLNNLGPDPGKNDVVIYSLKGEVIHRKARSVVFDETAQRYFGHIHGVVFWLANAWLDEKRDQIVIIGPRNEGLTPPRLVFTVGISSGEVRRAGFDVIDLAISERNPAALSGALDLAYELRLAGGKAAWPGIAEDETVALGARLRAAVLLASFGDRWGAPLVSKTALRAADSPANLGRIKYDLEVDYAIRHLPELMGEDALPVLTKTLRTNGRNYIQARAEAFCKLGPKSVPMLVTVLEDDQNFDAQYEAVTCLGYLRADAEAAVPALIKALHKKAGKQYGMLYLRLDSNAVWALELIGEKAKTAIPDLEELAKTGNQDARRALATIRKEPTLP
jgi:hypothetical protein